MQQLTERNESRRRTQALVLAVTLHLGLAAALYLQTSSAPTAPAAGKTTHTEQRTTAAQPRTVNMASDRP